MSEVVKVTPEAKELLRKLAEKTGKSERDLASEAIIAYFRGVEGEKEIKSITPLRPIVLKYQAKCYRCKVELREGSLAYYQKITYTDNTFRGFILCPQCASMEDVLASKYVKKYELEATIRGLKRKADQLAQEILELEKFVQLKTVFGEIERELRELREFLRTYNYPREALDRLQQFYDKLQQLEEKLDSTLEGLRDLILPKIKRREKEVEAHGGRR
jgi:prefoldin subunit 5